MHTLLFENGPSLKSCDRVLSLISALKTKEKFVEALVVSLFTKGHCADLFLILKAAFPQAKCYGFAQWIDVECCIDLISLEEEIGYDHILTSIDGELYDIRGKFERGIEISEVTDRIIKGNKGTVEVYRELVKEEFEDFLINSKKVEPALKKLCQAKKGALECTLYYSRMAIVKELRG